MRTFGERAKEFLDTNYNYDIVIDNQSISYGMLEIQKKFPLIEIIHHPITKDYQYELKLSDKFLYRLSRHRWYSFLKMQKRVAKKLNTIVTVSQNSLKDISIDFNINKDNITVIHNGLDIDIFIPYEEIKRNPTKLITTASADVALKGLDYTLKSLASLTDDFPEISLTVIGKLKKGGHTSRLIDELGIKDKVFFKTDFKVKSNALNLELLNYTKKKDVKSNLIVDGDINKNNSVFLNKINFAESKNLIKVKNINLNSKKKFISIKLQ